MSETSVCFKFTVYFYVLYLRVSFKFREFLLPFRIDTATVTVTDWYEPIEIVGTRQTESLTDFSHGRLFSIGGSFFVLFSYMDVMS